MSSPLHPIGRAGPGVPTATLDHGFAPPVPGRTIACQRCRVRQPVGGWGRCVACGAPLRRWVAVPPPGTVPRRPRARPQSPYQGPPAYLGGHPRWAFPPVVWQEADADPGDRRRRTDPSGSLRAAFALACVSAVASSIAAVAEIWRFGLMLEGRTTVLPGPTVRASDVFVAAAGIGAPAAAVAALVVAAIALVRTHPVAAMRLGRAPSRSTGGVLARVLVPGWNLYGAGQIVTEIDRMLTARQVDPARPARASWLTACWWVSWVVSAVLMAAALVRGLGGSLQAIADTVELHIAVDLAATVTAGLGAAMLLRFARLLRRRHAIPDGWVIAAPAPTRG